MGFGHCRPNVIGGLEDIMIGTKQCAQCGTEALPPSNEELERMGFINPTMASRISRTWPDGSRDFFCSFEHYFTFKEGHPEKS